MLDVAIKKTLDNFTLDVSFKVKKGIVGILGPSGCGKSLTLQAIAGLLKPDAGKITIGERVLFDEKQKINTPTRSRKVGYVFQNYALFPHLSVAENISFGLKGLSKSEKKVKVTNMLETVQLKGLENRYPHELSGGQQQRVALARTLVTKPDILLLDEPFSALDQHVKKVLELQLLEIIKGNFSGLVLFVTHDIEEAYRISDYICLYDNGSNIQFGEKETVLQRPINKAAARIVGCQNIFRVDSVKRNSIFINGLKLELDYSSFDQKQYVGIHSYEAMFVPKGEIEANKFEFDINSIVDSIDHSTICVNISGVLFKVDVPKASVKEISKENSMVYLPPEKLFLLD